ncbi:MAG: AAA family ATPase [Sedimentisphaeraceae bacterium JB056]
MQDYLEIAKLIQGGNRFIYIETHEERDTLDILVQTTLELKKSMCIWSLGYGVRDGMMAESEAYEDTDKPALGLCHFAMNGDDKICVALDLVSHLEDKLNLRIMRDTLAKLEKNNGVLILIESQDTLPEVLKSYAKTYDISLPKEDELVNLVKQTLREIHSCNPIEVGITQRGMDAVVRNLRGLTRRQAKQLVKDCVAEDKMFDDNDVNTVIAGKRKMLQKEGLLEFIQSPLDLKEIGGMNNLKKWLKHRKAAFSDKASEYGLDVPRGVLMLGVQGAGKSLCAKAVSTAWKQPLLRLDPNVLYNSYIGQSEKNLRDALRQTEFMSPVILWIDEIEKAFAGASSQSSDGGLSRRMFGSLLTWMQEHKTPVFVIATANDIEALPPELLRKGRFDEIFFVGLPKAEARERIFEIHLKKRKQKPEDFDVSLLVKESDGFSGAEIEQAILSALHKSFARKTDLTTEMIVKVLQTSPPLSVTMREKIANLYQWAEGRCVPAD